MEALHGASSWIPFILQLFFKISLEVKIRQAILKDKHGVQHMFCFEEFKHSSSCIPKCNSLSYLSRWCCIILDNPPWWFMIHMLSRMRYFKSTNLFVGFILCMFHLKPSLRNVAIMVLINDPSFLLSSWWKKFFISLVFSIKVIVSVSGRLSPHNFEMCSISPQQACSFRCCFPNNSVITFLEGCF